jgi:bacillolysin
MRSRHHTPPHWQWLRVAALAAGLGAAITTGQAVASADAPGSSDSSGSSDSASSGSASSAGSADSADSSGDDATKAEARPVRGPKSARLASGSTKPRVASAISDRRTLGGIRRSARTPTEADETTAVEPTETTKPDETVGSPEPAQGPAPTETLETEPASASAVPSVAPARPDVHVTRNADGTVRVVDGAFTDTNVTSAADAATLLNSLATALGTTAGFASADNITVARIGDDDTGPGAVTEVFYRLSAKIEDVPVLGSDMILVTDADGRVTGLFNNYDSRVTGMDLAADTRIDHRVEAIAVASLSYLTAASTWSNPLGLLGFVTLSRFEPELVAYALDAETAPRLAWRVVVKPSDFPQLLGLAAPDPGVTYFIYANGSDAGTVLVETSNAQALSTVSATSFANDALGQRRQIDVARLDLLIFSFYSLQDASRNLATYQTGYFFGFGPPRIPGTVAFQGLFGWSTSAVSAHANMATVYDYYSNVLGLNSFDGDGAKVTVSVNYNPHNDVPDYLSGYSNAFWDPSAQQFAFGDSGELEAALDVVGHEYTHAVVSHTVGNGGSVLDYGESGALNEAYADILGSLIEGKSGQDRWLLGEDSSFAGGPLRNLADPTSIITAYGPYRDHYGSRYTGTGDEAGEHINSTIFSHAAYLMMTDPATSDVSDETWARVFYHSLYRLSPGATFTDGRAAVSNTASAFGLTSAQQQAIERAFDTVGIANTGIVNAGIVNVAAIMV